MLLLIKDLELIKFWVDVAKPIAIETLFVVQCTLHNSIHYYSIFSTNRPQFNVPAFFCGISKNNSKLWSTFNVLFEL